MSENFNILEPGIFNKSRIISGVTLRNEHIFPDPGFSIYSGQSVSEEGVKDKRKNLAKVLDVDENSLKFQKQIHGSHIRYIDANSQIEESDGMFTDRKGIILNITIADCCAILIYDPAHEVVSALHSGWRGAKENIAAKGIKTLQKKYNSNPQDLKIYMSPCASVRNYEVGEEVAQFFPGFIEEREGSIYLDLKKKILTQLIETGCREENIEISDICTIEDHRFHSYRRDKENSGRMAAFIGMRL